MPGPNGFFRKYRGSSLRRDLSVEISYDTGKGVMIVLELSDKGNKPPTASVRSGAYACESISGREIAPGRTFRDRRNLING